MRGAIPNKLVACHVIRARGAMLVRDVLGLAMVATVDWAVTAEPTAFIVPANMQHVVKKPAQVAVTEPRVSASNNKRQ